MPVKCVLTGYMAFSERPHSRQHTFHLIIPFSTHFSDVARKASPSRAGTITSVTSILDYGNEQ